MFEARRPLGWLFLLLPVLVPLAVSAQTLPTTTINDTVYRPTELQPKGRCLFRGLSLPLRRWGQWRRETRVPRSGRGCAVCRLGCRCKRDTRRYDLHRRLSTG